MAGAANVLALNQIDGHRMQAWCANQPTAFIGGEHSFRRLPWISEFVAALTNADWRELERTGLKISRVIIESKIDWHLLNAIMAFWNPYTHTFFFPTGEMGIFQEELAPLLGIRGVENITDVALVGRREHNSFDNLPGGYLIGCQRGELLDLRRFWMLHQNLILTPMGKLTNPQERRAFEMRSKAILILFGGVFLFTRADYRIPYMHAGLLAARFAHPGKHFVHPILAYLNEGLGSASMCGNFFGSPWLVQQWIYAHFPSTGQIEEDNSVIRMPQRQVGACLNHFSHLSDEEVIFAPYQTACVLVPRTLGDLYLVGAGSFVAYTVTRCCRMLGQTDLNINPVPTINLMVPRGDIDTDQLLLATLLEAWLTHPVMITLPNSGSNNRSLSVYLTQMRSLVPIYGPSADDAPESSRRRRRHR